MRELNVIEWWEKKAIDEVAKARKVLEDAEKKMHNSKRKVFFEAAKTARRWMEGKLDPLDSLVGARRGTINSSGTLNRNDSKKVTFNFSARPT